MIKLLEDSQETFHMITDTTDEQLQVTIIGFQEVIVLIKKIEIFFDVKDRVKA